MRATRTALALAGLTLVTATLAGCANAGTPAGDASSFGEISGSAVPVADELTALCEEIVTQALPLDAATALAEAGGYVSRVTVLDGEGQAATTDLREDRMNFEVENDIVTACTVG